MKPKRALAGALVAVVAAMLLAPAATAAGVENVTVTVAPELSSSSVFSAGTPQAAIGVNASVAWGPAVGHTALKSGQSSFCSMSPRSGTASTRT